MAQHLRLDHGAGLEAAGEREQIEARHDVGDIALGRHGAFVEDDDAVGEPRHFVDGVADIDDGHAGGVAEPLQIG